MKAIKIIAMSAALSLAVVASASAAMTTVYDDTGTITYGTPSVGIKPSKNTKVGYLRSTTASGSGKIGYSINAWHTSGDKTFASSSGDTKIFWSQGTGNDAVAAPEAAGVSAGFAAGWTAM